jgi:SAUR family protein
MKGGRRSRNSNRRLLASFLNACRKLSAAAAAPTAAHEWAQLHAGADEAAAIPVDVPRGHTVVYVGEELRRYVVRVSSLDHPLFRDLLDRAREEYQFATDARLCLPCDEDIFLAVLCHVDSRHELWRLALCS